MTRGNQLFSPNTLLLLAFVALAQPALAQRFWSTSDKSEADAALYMQQNVRTPRLPESLELAGEQVPLQYFDVRESLERELTINAFWHSQAVNMLKLAHRYFPTIEALLRMHNVPDDFKYLCVAESGLQQAVSPMKAVGFWQLLPHTAKELGLEVNDEVDERYHVERATVAACKYLHKAHDTFGSWTMAAASYNMGVNGLRQQVVRQKSLSYYDMKLSDETTRYLFRILALKLILSNPQQYGYHLREDELYPPFRYKEIIVNTAVESWADFAAQYGTNYKMLKLLNPWLREPFLKNKAGKTYYVKVIEGR